MPSAERPMVNRPGTRPLTEIALGLALSAAAGSAILRICRERGDPPSMVALVRANILWGIVDGVGDLIGALCASAPRLAVNLAPDPRAPTEPEEWTPRRIPKP